MVKICYYFIDVRKGFFLAGAGRCPDIGNPYSLRSSERSHAANVDECFDPAYTKDKTCFVYSAAHRMCIWAECDPLQQDNSATGYQTYTKIGRTTFIY